MAVKTYLMKNLNPSGLSGHPPVRGKFLKRLGGIIRLQIQNLFMAFKRVPRCDGSNIGSTV